MKKRHDNSEGNTILQTTAHWTCAWGLKWNSAFSESWMSLARFSLPYATLEPGQLMLWAARREFCSPCRSSGLIYYSSHSPLHLLPVCFSDCIRGCRTLLYWPSLLGCRQGRATLLGGWGSDQSSAISIKSRLLLHLTYLSAKGGIKFHFGVLSGKGEVFFTEQKNQRSHLILRNRTQRCFFYPHVWGTDLIPSSNQLSLLRFEV